MATVATSTDKGATASFVDWRAIIAGAVAAAALSVLLLGFGAAIGLSFTSARPFSGASLSTTAIILGIWLALVHVASFAAGGYIAGRMSGPQTASGSEEGFREGAHGFLVWALGTLIGAYVIASTAGAITSRAVDVAGQTAAAGISTMAVGATAASQSPQSGGIAQQLIAYNTDRLFRRTGPSGPPQPGAAPSQPVQPVDPATVQEATRIIATSVVNGALTPADRDYLAGIVARTANVPQADAAARVEEIYNSVANARAEAERRARDAAETARKSTILGAFLTAAVSLAGLVAAAWAAGVGGQDRRQGRDPRVLGRDRLW